MCDDKDLLMCDKAGEGDGEPIVCPFCGSNSLDVGWSTYAYMVSCLDCHAIGPYGDSVEEAIFKWNKTRYRGK